MDGEMSAIRTRLAAILKDIKPAHTVFALPFTLAGAVLAIDFEGSFGGGGVGTETAVWKFLWILAAAFGARCVAMAFNRLADAKFDAQNPRTADRPLPAGIAARRDYAAFIAVNAAIFFLAAGMLNPLALALAPLVLIILCGYSAAKRFTPATHFILGLCLGIAPVGAWIAITGRIEGIEQACLLGAAVLFWVAGFDIIYSCQDYAIDVKLGVRSIPGSLGIRGALLVSAISHIIMMALLIARWTLVPRLGWIFGLGCGIAAVLLFAEHAIVGAGDLGRVNTAFFRLNAAVSVVVASAMAADCLA